MINKDFAQTLEQFINESVNKFAIPSSNGKIIRIKHYLVRQTAKGYVVFDISENRQIAFTNFKTSAVAIAKSLSEGKDRINQVLRLDKIISKNYNDAVFYKNTIKQSKDITVKETRRARLEIALDKATHAKQSLEDFIF
jgi:predicted lipase